MSATDRLSDRHAESGILSQCLQFMLFKCGREVILLVGPSRCVVIHGTVSATHWRWHGVEKGNSLITLCVSWIMGDAMRPDQSEGHWKIMMRGKPGIDITMNLVAPEQMGVKTKSEQYAVAGSVINSIPEVCAAKPGIFELHLFAPFRARF